MSPSQALLSFKHHGYVPVLSAFIFLLVEGPASVTWLIQDCCSATEERPAAGVIMPNHSRVLESLPTIPSAL